MRPELYADLYRQYQTYVRNYGDNQIYRIAGGANVDDYNWTEVLMREAGHMMDGLSIHYYVHPGGWENKGSATEFTEDEWTTTMEKALHIEELIRRHSTIMDKYDPDKRIGMIIDEWGTWFDAEPGTNPGFLYQQNTIRDALVAGLSFNIFHDHSDRVQMANIAQTINVLQAMILTDGAEMILTPTYHVFEMYKVHQDAQKLAVHAKTTSTVKSGNKDLPQVSVSASKDKKGKINISLCNLDHLSGITVELDLRGVIDSINVSGRVLTAENMNDRNTFKNPEVIKPRIFEDFHVDGHNLTITLPSKSVTVLSIET